MESANACALPVLELAKCGVIGPQPWLCSFPLAPSFLHSGIADLSSPNSDFTSTPASLRAAAACCPSFTSP
eukprot:746938-Hanusia_phi.AAC.3